MLRQYLVWLGAPNLRQWMRRSDKAANSPQADKKSTFHVVSGKLLHRFPKINFTTKPRLSLVLNLFLVFHQISVSCSYEIVFYKSRVYIFLICSYCPIPSYFSMNSTVLNTVLNYWSFFSSRDPLLRSYSCLFRMELCLDGICPLNYINVLLLPLGHTIAVTK